MNIARENIYAHISISSLHVFQPNAYFNNLTVDTRKTKPSSVHLTL